VGSRLNIETIVGLSGYSATKVLLSVKEDGRTVKTEEFNLRGNDTQAINLEITPTTPGVHRYTVEVTPLDGEITVDNNKQDSLVEVIEGPLRILHVEGEPRWELGKIRESIQPNEKNITMVALQRTGENKFYRQGIGNQGELATGFPKTEEELFSYDGLIIGSVEAGFFTAEQMRSIEAFVSRRGGGLLALGGRLSFDGGKYKGTVLEVLTNIKPGASVLLEARRVEGPAQVAPLLVQQRYGRGQTLALTAADTWRWKMRMDSKSNAHETFWRQMLRYLVSGTPRQIEIGTEKEVYALDDNVNIVAH